MIGMIRIAINGALGKMGLRVKALAAERKDFLVIGGLERKDHPDFSRFKEFPLFEKIDLLPDFDCLIDFSTPTAMGANLENVVQRKKALVIGTTGFSEQGVAQIHKAAVHIPIVFSPNMSVGVNLLFTLVGQAAKILQRDYSIAVTEAHHIHKKDSPSGTAKKIVDILNQHSRTMSYKDISAIREGEIIGDHKIVFESDVDTIVISHSAKTRDIFVQGALQAALWIVHKQPGIYTMQDILFT